MYISSHEIQTKIQFSISYSFLPLQLYDMISSRKKGFAFVLNNKNFPNHPNERSRIRQGSDVDLNNMTRMWEQIGYEVTKHEDLTGKVSKYFLK